MSYCLNPACTNPHNSPQDQICCACGQALVLRDRYRATKVLGRGGFATTFLAIDQTLPGTPTCVIKQLRSVASNPEAKEMARTLFQREASTLGSMGHHPQLPRLLDYYELDGEFYLIQEYVKGSTLKQEVDRFGPLSEPMVEAALREVLPILDYLHNQGVIHRDIKPANIMRRSIDNKLVLIDFGAVIDQVNQVKTSDAQENSTAILFAVGTNGYAPPEQFSMRPVFASDLYSLGVTCLYLLTGKSPKQGAGDQKMGLLTWLNQLDISPYLHNILTNMLAVSPQDRYQSAKEVLAALEPQDQTSDLSNPLSISVPAVSPVNEIPRSDQIVSSHLETKYSPEPRLNPINRSRLLLTRSFSGFFGQQSGSQAAIPKPTTWSSKLYPFLGSQKAVKGASKWRFWLGSTCVSMTMILIGFGFSQFVDNRQIAQEPRNGLSANVQDQPLLPQLNKAQHGQGVQEQNIKKSQVLSSHQPSQLEKNIASLQTKVEALSGQIQSIQGASRGNVSQGSPPVASSPATSASANQQSVNPSLNSAPPIAPSPKLAPSTETSPSVVIRGETTTPITPNSQSVRSPVSSSFNGIGGATLSQSLPTSRSLPRQGDEPKYIGSEKETALPSRSQVQSQSSMNPEFQRPSEAQIAFIQASSESEKEITTHDIANAIVRGLVVAHRHGDVHRWSRTYMQVQDVIYRLRLGQNRHYAAQRAGVPQTLIEKLLTLGGLPPAEPSRAPQSVFNILG